MSHEPRQPAASVGRSLYNPDWLTDDDVVAGFIARQNVFDDLRDSLKRTPAVGNAQHYLLVGVRGAGKTTLLKRLGVAIRRDPELADHLIALSFPEELYQVKHLADFWWAAADALADALEQEGLRAESDALAKAIEGRDRQASEAQHDDAGLRCLLDTCAAIGRRPVLLVDNLDLVMRRIDKRGRKIKNPDGAYWALREALSTNISPVVIGGSVRLSEPFIGHDKAFYDFFLPKRLGKLTLDEVKEILRHLAEVHGEADLRQELDDRPGRIRALYDLTGANPRAIGIVFEFVRQRPSSCAVDDFERLLDLTTPYYKARFEDLPEQAQVVMHALATTRQQDDTAKTHVNIYGHTAAAVSGSAGLETRVVSAQLEKLVNEGVVEKEGGGKGQGKMRYRIAEQLFRLWIQMRTNRRLRLNTIWLSEFLEAFWEADAREAALDPQRLAEAERAYQHAIERDPTRDALWNNLGVLYEQNHRVAGAESAFRQAIKLDASSEKGWWRLGRVLSGQLTKRREAEAALGQAVKLDPSLTSAARLLERLRTRAAIEVIATLLATDDWSTVEEALRRLIADPARAARTFADGAFIEGVVAKGFHAGLGARLLEVLRTVGFERYAAPLMLALDAAVDDASGKLMRAPPEVRSAAFRLYERILNAAAPA